MPKLSDIMNQLQEQDRIAKATAERENAEESQVRRQMSDVISNLTEAAVGPAERAQAEEAQLDRDEAEDLAADAEHLDSGRYTGDGTTSQVITGTGDTIEIRRVMEVNDSMGATVAPARGEEGDRAWALRRAAAEANHAWGMTHHRGGRQLNCNRCGVSKQDLLDCETSDELDPFEECAVAGAVTGTPDEAVFTQLSTPPTITPEIRLARLTQRVHGMHDWNIQTSKCFRCGVAEDALLAVSKESDLSQFMGCSEARDSEGMIRDLMGISSSAAGVMEDPLVTTLDDRCKVTACKHRPEFHAPDGTHRCLAPSCLRANASGGCVAYQDPRGPRYNDEHAFQGQATIDGIQATVQDLLRGSATPAAESTLEELDRLGPKEEKWLCRTCSHTSLLHSAAGKHACREGALPPTTEDPGWPSTCICLGGYEDPRGSEYNNTPFFHRRAAAAQEMVKDFDKARKPKRKPPGDLPVRSID